MRIEDAILDYINYLRYSNPKGKDTINAYGNDLRKFHTYLTSLGVYDLREVSEEHVRNYFLLLEETHKRSSIYRKSVAIRNFFTFFEKTGDLDVNPATSLKIKSQGKRVVHTLSESEVRQLMSFKLVNDKDYLDLTICIILFTSGLRVSELTHLTISQIYFEEKMIRVTGKGNKDRIVFLNDQALEILLYYIDNIRSKYVPLTQSKYRNLLLISAKGRPISRNTIYNMIQYRSDQTGIHKKISPHTLRHAFATRLLEKEVDLRVIQELLGHSDITTTQVYTHVDKSKVIRDYDKYHPGSKLGKGDKNE